MTRPNLFQPRLVATLKASPLGLSQPDLCALMSASQAQVSRGLSALRDRDEVYICRWAHAKHVGGPPVAFYALGNKEDVPCTVRKLSPAERTRRHRARKRDAEREPTIFETLHACFFGLSA